MFLFVFLLASGCGYFQSQSDKDKEESKWPEDRLYNMAKQKLDFGSCGGAIEYYEKLQARYPFGVYTQQSQIELAYCYFRTDDPMMAITTIDRFIKLYPTHANMSYAFYLRGLINFGRGKGLAERWLPKDGSQRDPGMSLESFNDFSEVVKTFPESIYVEDSRLRMRYLRNQLAQHEVNVSNYYMRITAKDITGVLSKITSYFNESDISVKKILQLPDTEKYQENIPIIITTHSVKKNKLLDSIKKIEKQNFISEKISIIPIYNN